MNNIIKQLLKFSYDFQLTHVPSALSMLTYIDTIFTEKLIVPYRDKIVLGKPFGSQAYYTVWKNNSYINNIDSLSVGVKSYEIDFVNYSEETMGNAMGVGCGIAMANPGVKTWINITDGTLQMGSTLEAIQYIGQNSIKNIIVTVDNNNYQVTGETSSIISVEPVINFFKENKWKVIICNGHDRKEIKKCFPKNNKYPTVIIFNTIKGYGVPYMENDPVKWHYKPIEKIT